MATKTTELMTLIAQANWAVELLGKHAVPYNHEYTCAKRLVEAIGAIERTFPGSSSIQCPHCRWGFDPSVIDQHVREKHAEG